MSDEGITEEELLVRTVAHMRELGFTVQEPLDERDMVGLVSVGDIVVYIPWTGMCLAAWLNGWLLRGKFEFEEPEL